MKYKQLIRQYWVLMLIVLFAGCLRCIALGQTPSSLNIDEQALGYNAYSLLKTGLDEHGKFFPISLESFGDWKLIGYPMLLMPCIALFGLHDWVIRFPSALAGIAQVILVYFLTLSFFQKKRIALFSAFFLSASPWNIYFSRMAYEANVATAFLLVGVLAYTTYLQNTRKNSLFIIACIFFGFTIYVYHSFIIFTPLFFLSIFFLQRKKIVWNVPIFFSLCALLFASFFVFHSAFVQSSGKLSSLAVWSDTNTIYHRGEIFRTDGSNDTFLGRVFYSKPFVITYQIAQNYLSAFSPSFLFDTGGQKLVNSLGYFGNLYILDGILLILGCVYIAYAQIKYKTVLCMWLFVGLIPSAITIDAPSATRLFLLLPLLAITASCGAEYLIQLSKKYNWIIFGNIIFVFLYGMSILFFIDAYFVHVDYQRAEFLHFGYKQAVLLSQKYPNDGVIMVGPENFPYISFLLYNSYDPTEFRKEVTYYPKSKGVFEEVSGFGKYKFVDSINYTHLLPNTLYIDSRGIGANDKKIVLPNGRPVFKYFFKS